MSQNKTPRKYTQSPEYSQYTKVICQSDVWYEITRKKSLKKYKKCELTWNLQQSFASNPLIQKQQYKRKPQISRRTREVFYSDIDSRSEVVSPKNKDGVKPKINHKEISK